MLVNPKPRSLSNLEPWRNFQARVCELRPAALEAIADRVCRQQEKAYPALAKCVRRQLTAAREDDDLARELVRISLSLKELTAYASYPTKGKAFAIDPQVWDVMARDYHDAHRSIDEGVFAIDVAKKRGAKTRARARKQTSLHRWRRFKPLAADQAQWGAAAQDRQGDHQTLQRPKPQAADAQRRLHQGCRGPTSRAEPRAG